MMPILLWGGRGGRIRGEEGHRGRSNIFVYFREGILRRDHNDKRKSIYS
jgi:hypothetical protein